MAALRRGSVVPRSNLTEELAAFNKSKGNSSKGKKAVAGAEKRYF